jgi:hypothetical protein
MWEMCAKFAPQSIIVSALHIECDLCDLSTLSFTCGKVITVHAQINVLGRISIATTLRYSLMHVPRPTVEGRKSDRSYL